MRRTRGALLLAWLAVYLVLGLALTAHFWNLYRQAIQSTSEHAELVANKLEVPPPVAIKIEEVSRHVPNAVFVALARLSSYWIGALLVLILLWTAAQKVLHRLLLRKLADPDVRCASQRLEGELSWTRLWLAGGLLVGGLMVIRQDNVSQVLFESPVILFLSLLLLIALFYSIYLLVLARKIRGSEDLQAEFQILSFRPDRRVALYLELTLALLSVLALTGAFPAMQGDLRDFPSRIRHYHEIPERKRAVREVRDTVIRIAEESTSKSGDSREADVARAREHALYWLSTVLPGSPAQMSAEEGARAAADHLDGLRVELMATVSIVFTLAALLGAASPWLVRDLAREGWRGVLHAPRFGNALRMALPAVLLVLVLDRLGVTSERPALWLLIFVPVAMIDVILSWRSGGTRKVYCLPGRDTYHLSSRCSMLGQAEPKRVFAVPLETARVLRRSKCRRCAQN